MHKELAALVYCLAFSQCMLLFQISSITYYRTSALIYPYAAYIKSSVENGHKF